MFLAVIPKLSAKLAVTPILTTCLAACACPPGVRCGRPLLHACTIEQSFSCPRCLYALNVHYGFLLHPHCAMWLLFCSLALPSGAPNTLSAP